MKKKFAFLVLLVSAVTLSFAQPQGGKKKFKQGKDMHKHRTHQRHEQLKLTDEQKEEMKTIRLDGYKAIKPLKNELNELEARHKTLTTADKANIKAIEQNIDAISSVKTKIAKIRARNHQKVRALLTEEQLMKFDEMKNRKGQRYTAKHRKAVKNPRAGNARLGKF